MNVNVKHIVEIAVGITVGTLTYDAVDKVIDITKSAIVNHKNKGAK